MLALQTKRGWFSWWQLAVLQAVMLLSACGDSASTTGGKVAGETANPAARADMLEFREGNTAGVMCAALPQDSTLSWDTPRHGNFILFDDAHDGKGLCYAAFMEGTTETLSILVKLADGSFLRGSGLVKIDVSRTYHTNPFIVTNRKPSANAGEDIQQADEGSPVTLNGSGSSDPDGDTLSYHWVQTAGPSAVGPTGENTTTLAFTAPQVDADTVLTFALTVKDGHSINYSATDTVNVRVRNVADVIPSGKLNDTGITLCGDYAYDGGSGRHDADVDCARLNDADGDPVPPAIRLTGTGQDGHVGRDLPPATDSDGHAGFSFTKIGANGEELPASAASWHCVRDNVTHLIWEAKTTDNGLHHRDWTYTWYEPDGSRNGGVAGTQDGGRCNATSRCDTAGYVAAVNTAGWCGASDWRMPGVNELLSIADLSRSEPAIDTAYFPHINPRGYYWSATPYVDATRGGAWNVYFGEGVSGWSSHGIAYYYVRLVRSAP